MTPFAAHAPHPAPDAAPGRRTDTGPEETGSEEAVNRSGFNDAYDDAKPAREGAGPERREAAEDRRGAPDAPPPSHQEGRQKAKEEGTRPAEQTPPPKVAGSDSIAEIQFDGSPEAALPDADAALLSQKQQREADAPLPHPLTTKDTAGLPPATAPAATKAAQISDAEAAPQTATPTASAADAKAPPLPITSTSVKRVAPLEQSEARAPQPANAAPISPEPTVSAPGVETALQVTDQAAPQATGVDEPANSGEQPQARPSAPQHPEGAAEALVEPRTIAQQPQPATPTADAAPAQISQAAAPLDESFTPPPDAEAAPKAAAPASSAPTTTTSEAPPAVAAFEAAQKTGAADPALVNANDGEGRFSAGDAPVPGLNSASQSASNDAGLRAATAALTSPETGRSVAAQVASQLSTAAVHRPADNRLELRLDPPELGRVEIEFTFEKDAMKVVVRAEREEALDLMRRHADELARELEEAGLRLGDLSFSAGGFEDQASGDNEDRAALEGLRRGVRPAADPVPHGAIAIDAEARAAMGLAPGRVDLRI